MKKFNMAELKAVSTPMSMATMLDSDKNGEVVDQREYRSMIDSLQGVQEHDWLPLVPHDDTAGHSVHRVPVCTLSGFSTLFTSDNSLVNLQVPQIHTRIWDLVFCLFFT
jgi:hypothetical protein